MTRLSSPAAEKQVITVTLTPRAHQALLALLDKERMETSLTDGELEALKTLKEVRK